MAERSSSNARWLIASKAATKLGDLLCNAKTTVPWLMLSVGAPAGFIGLLVPVRESGSMLPQVLIAPWVQRIEPRKRAAIGGMLGQAAAAVGLAAFAYASRGLVAGVGIVVALGMLALARALVSLSNKDVLARAVPKGERGKVGGRASSLAGLIGLGGAAATLLIHRPESSGLLALVVGAGALGFGFGALALLRVTEDPQQTKTKTRPSLREALSQPRLRRFIIVRTLLTGSAMGGPFIVAMGREHAASLQTLSAFVLASGAAKSVSAGLWGRLADRTGRGCMAAGGVLAATAAGGVLLVRAATPDASMWVWAGLYFAFSIGYVGVRVGRKTYVVDLADGDARTQFVASSNTAVALALLALGAATAAIPTASAALATCLGITLAGAMGCAALAKA